MGNKNRPLTSIRVGGAKSATRHRSKNLRKKAVK